jgi:hypothetical protein
MRGGPNQLHDHAQVFCFSKTEQVALHMRQLQNTPAALCWQQVLASNWGSSPRCPMHSGTWLAIGSMPYHALVVDMLHVLCHEVAWLNLSQAWHSVQQPSAVHGQPG